MRTAHRLRSSTWAASGTDSVPLSAIPSGSQGNMVPYVTCIEVMCDVTLTTGATAASALTLANLLNSMTVQVPGGPWGPVALSGEQLRIHDFYQTGEPIPYASNTSGDAQIAASTTAGTRRIRHFYDYEKLGPPDDPFAFCPPAAAFREGSIEFGFSAIPATGSAATITFSTIVHVVWRAEAQTVSRVRTVSKALVGSGETITDSGLLIRLVARTSSDAVAGDFTGWRLYKDGFQLLNINRPMDVRGRDYSEVAAVTTSQIQETLCDPIGGNFVRGVNIYPVDGPRRRLGDLPVGDNWLYEFDGSPTLANWSLLYTLAYRQSEDHVQRVLGGCGCDITKLAPQTGEAGKKLPSTAVLVPRGPSGSILTSSRLNGFTPMTQVSRQTALARAAIGMGTVK